MSHVHRPYVSRRDFLRRTALMMKIPYNTTTAGALAGRADWYYDHALAMLAEPHSYDLCSEHAGRLTAPRGWEVVRLVTQRNQIQIKINKVIPLSAIGREFPLRISMIK